MIGILLLAALAVVVVGSYTTARRFVRDRLRYVDAALAPAAPWVAFAGAALFGVGATTVLPWYGIGSALAFAASVGAGVHAGARDIRVGSGYRLEG
jgi:hypothetical protein